MGEARATDEEKAVSTTIVPSPSSTSQTPPPGHPQSSWQKWHTKISTITGLETRGLERVPPDEHLAPSWKNSLEMLFLWLSSNMTIICTLAAVTGPAIFGLGFTDSTLCVVFGTLLGAMSTAYISTWAQSVGRGRWSLRGS